FSISCNVHSNAAVAAFTSVITGLIKCGIPLYGANSTIFGSINIIFTSTGEALYNKLTKIELIQTDFPEPVAPAINPCGIFRKSRVTGSPVNPSPNTASIGDVDCWKEVD